MKDISKYFNYWTFYRKTSLFLNICYQLYNLICWVELNWNILTRIFFISFFFYWLHIFFIWIRELIKDKLEIKFFIGKIGKTGEKI